MAAKKKNSIPRATVKTILAECGAYQSSKAARNGIAMIVEDFIREIAVRAIRSAKRGKRKKVMLKDVIQAVGNET